MSQCVPNWDVHDNPVPARLSARSHSNSIPPDVTILDYEVAELTWENGQLAMHGLGQPRVSLKPQPLQPSSATTLSNKYTWDKLPRATGTGTLESIVNQAATSLPQRKQPLPTFDDLVPWFDRPGATTSATMTRDALVPCAAAAAIADHHQRKLQEQAITARLLNESSTVPPTRVVDCSTHVGSCSGAAAAAALQEDDARKRSRVSAAVRVPVVAAGEWSGRDQHSVSGSATVGRERDSLQMTVDTCEREVYNSVASHDNTSSGDPPCTRATAEEHDSVCHSQSQREAGDEDEKVKRNGKSSVSTKRSRAAAIHNQSERKRRDKINQRMKTLQKLVPNSSKTDKASVLDEVIEYLKQLQAQVQMMSRMNMQPMMLPMAMQQQQLQMSMMAPMGLGMGMGMGMGMPGVMDLNALARHNLPVMPNATAPILHPMAAAAAPFLPLAPPWDGSGSNGDRLHPNAAAALPDPLSAFLVSQSQPMTLDTYSRMAAMYQQLHQPPASSSKN